MLICMIDGFAPFELLILLLLAWSRWVRGRTAGSGSEHSFPPIMDRRCGHGFESCLVGTGLYTLYPRVMCPLPSIHSSQHISTNVDSNKIRFFIYDFLVIYYVFFKKSSDINLKVEKEKPVRETRQGGHCPVSRVGIASLRSPNGLFSSPG